MQQKISSRVVALLMVLTVAGFGSLAFAGDETAAQADEKTGIVGQFVRFAENNEGWVVVDYTTANGSVNEKWMLLDMGMTVQNGVRDEKIMRDQIRLVTPGDQVISLPTQEEVNKASGELDAMNARANIEGQSINYFPNGRTRPCRIGFFGDVDRAVGSLSFNQVEVDDRSACVGRIYFQVPDGIQYGQYNLDVQFADSVVRVPFKIMTKEEAKQFAKEWKESEKEAKEEKK